MNTQLQLNKRQIGDKHEKIVCDYLINKGYTILETNYISKFGEIDIIAAHKNYIVFIEVKYRKNVAYGYPSESVNYLKQRKIINTSLHYIHKNHISLDSNYRFDVISIIGKRIEHIENAYIL